MTEPDSSSSDWMMFKHIFGGLPPFGLGEKNEVPRSVYMPLVSCFDGNSDSVFSFRSTQGF